MTSQVASDWFELLGLYCNLAISPTLSFSMSVSAAHPLQNTWVIWEHRVLDKGEDWKLSMREICEFSSLEEFWKYWWVLLYLGRPDLIS